MALTSKDWKRIKMLQTKKRPQHKMWGMDNYYDNYCYRKGDIVVLKTLKPHTEWLEGGINYSRRSIFKKERRRVCVVQSIDSRKDTVELLTDDHFLLNNVPTKRCVP